MPRPRIKVKSPAKLYDLCINAAVLDCNCLCESCGTGFRSLPNTTLVEFYEKVSKLLQARRLCILTKEFSSLEIFNRVLSVKAKRFFLISSFQSLLNHDQNLTATLYTTFVKYTAKDSRRTDLNLIEMGLRVGNFFNEGGWYEYSIKFLTITEELIKEKCEETRNIHVLSKLLECYRMKLYAESMYCQFPNALQTFKEAQKLVQELEKLDSAPSLAATYCCFSIYYFVSSNFNESYKWAIKALELLPKGISSRTMLDILRQASKACVVKRRFLQAHLLINQAVNLGEKINLPTFSDVLMDYGFFLLNSDLVPESVIVYQKALNYRKRVFESNNIHIALAHEDLAYSLYVNEYSSGYFHTAKDHAESSIRIMEKVLTKDHLLLASVKRVKALILEEIALDERGIEEGKHDWLEVAEELHISALKLSKEAFGEKNAQTAKHYGNLGRLYQSMKRYDEAEKMHIKAIEIKEELLGPNDYEVGLSVGHLASLYNYHMKKYLQAEELYLRSIEINLKLFGPAYSGLEYDYRGLIHIYTRLAKPMKCYFFSSKYREWKELKDQKKPLEKMDVLLEPKEILRNFYEFEKEQKKVEEEGAKLAKQFPPKMLLDLDDLD